MSTGKPSPFSRLVVIQTSEPGRERRIGSAREAVEAMLEWPEERRGPAFRRAAKACRNALAGLNRDARVAFVEAAQEAGIFVREEARRRSS